MTTNSVYEEVIIAGFGGQGIILVGRLLAQTAMKAGKEVTYIPSYGAEMRGGTSNCTVIVSDEAIACPVVARPDSAIVMNKASLKKFAPRVQECGLLVLNSSLIDELFRLPESMDVLSVPANDLAFELGSVKSANMVMLGAYLERTGLFSAEEAACCLGDVLAKRHHKTLGVNSEALRRGSEFAARGA